jgi:hypothetical protein
MREALTPILLPIPLAFEGLVPARRLSTMNSVFKYAEQAIHRGERSTSWQGLVQARRLFHPPRPVDIGKEDIYPNASCRGEIPFQFNATKYLAILSPGSDGRAPVCSAVEIKCGGPKGTGD